jgi:hypothetical protein
MRPEPSPRRTSSALPHQAGGTPHNTQGGGDLRVVQGGQAVEDAAIANLVAEWTRIGMHPDRIKTLTSDARAMMRLIRGVKP